jgi:hypothetical protein
VTGEERGGRGKRRGGGRAGGPKPEGGGEPTGRPKGEGGGGRRAGGRTAAPRPPAHSLSLTVSGKGMELHCDTCDLVVGKLAGPQVRKHVEAAHRSHSTALEWESGWVATCKCGWRTGRVKQDLARQMMTDHEAGALQAAARGEIPGNSVPPGSPVM